MACSSVKVFTLRTAGGESSAKCGVEERRERERERGSGGFCPQSLTGEGCFVFDVDVFVLTVPFDGFL